MLIPDTNVADRGFHEVTLHALLDMTEVAGPAVHVGDLIILRRQWTLSVVSVCPRDRLIWNYYVMPVNNVFVGLGRDMLPVLWHHLYNIKHDMA